MARVKKLTPRLLRQMVLAERHRLVRETSDPVAAGVEDPEKVKAKELDADEQAGALEKDIDFMKALKIQERRLRRKLKKVSEARRRVGLRILKKV